MAETKKTIAGADAQVQGDGYRGPFQVTMLGYNLEVEIVYPIC